MTFQVKLKFFDKKKQLTFQYQLFGALNIPFKLSPIFSFFPKIGFCWNDKLLATLLQLNKKFIDLDLNFPEFC